MITERREKLQGGCAKRPGRLARHAAAAFHRSRHHGPLDQIRTRERELQERITADQKSWRDRNRIIQETAQYSLNQIERTLIAIIRQVAESRGMNLVLHRAQVALNVNELDITEQVTQQMNQDHAVHHHLARWRVAPGAEHATGGHAGFRVSRAEPDASLGTTRQPAGAPLGRAAAPWPSRRALATVGFLPELARTRCRAWRRWRVAARRPTPARSPGWRRCSSAEPNQVSFLDNRKYAPLLEQTRAGAVIVHPDLAGRVPPGSAAHRHGGALSRLGPRGRAVPSAAAAAAWHSRCRRGRGRRAGRCNGRDRALGGHRGRRLGWPTVPGRGRSGDWARRV